MYLILGLKLVNLAPSLLPQIIWRSENLSSSFIYLLMVSLANDLFSLWALNLEVSEVNDLLMLVAFYSILS